MHAVRHLLAQRRFVVLVCTAALLLKLLVPTGYMLGSARGVVTIMICSGTGPQSVSMAMPGMADAMAAMPDDMPDHGKSGEHGKSEAPCAYSGLSAQVIGAVDTILLLAALAVVARVTLLGSPRPAVQLAPYLRPPLRGPPLPKV